MCSTSRTYDGDLPQAGADQSVTLTLADEVDCSRGDVIVAADSPPEVATQFSATIVWMDAAPLLPGRSYWLTLGTQTVTVTIREPEYAIDVKTMAHLSASQGPYKKARVGEIVNLTGISNPYEPPENPELRIVTKMTSPEAAAELIIEHVLGIWSPVL